MIFPIPVEQTVLEERYTLRHSYPLESVYLFYRAAKQCCEDFRFTVCPELRPEEYTVAVDGQGIALSFATEAGCYRALTSVYQLIKDGMLPFCFVHDYPQFERRAYMLDINAGRIPRLETIFAYVDLLSALKYNEFQIYMDTPCYRYDRYSEYTKDFECLTPEDLDALEIYCRERFMELVPCQNSFGHMGAWLKFDQFRHLGIGDGIAASVSLNPLDPKSLEFVDGFYESLLPRFASEFVNVGCDEVYGLGEYQTKTACEERGRDSVFMDYLNKLADLAGEKYGKRIMFWDDMIVKYPESYHRIPKGAIALEWGYELIQSQIMAERCIRFREHGIDFYVCPSVNTHQSFTGRFDVTSFNLRTAGEVGRDHGAMGYMVTDWGMYGHPQFPVMSWLPCALGGQYAWNVGVEQDGETFKTEFIYAAEDYLDQFVFGTKLSRLLYRLANYYLLEPERVHVGTMCGHTFNQPMKNSPTKFINLEKCGDSFYFDNVDRYVRQVMEDIARTDAEAVLKEQILVNAHMVLLANQLNKIRTEGGLTDEDYSRLVQDADRIREDFARLWDLHNFPEGKSVYLSILAARLEETKEFVN